MERRRKDSRRYSRIDEGRWNDEEKIHGVILGSTKVDGNMKKYSTSLFQDRRSLMERYRKNPGRYSMIDERKWKDNEKNFDNIQGQLKDDEISISNQRFKILFKLKNQIPILNLRKCLSQFHLRQKTPIYNPRIKIQFPI